MSLLQSGDDRSVGDTPRLIVVARRSGAAVEIEFLAALDGENLEDRLADLGDEGSAVPLGSLRHNATTLRHQKFHGLDVVTVRVTERS